MNRRRFVSASNLLVASAIGRNALAQVEYSNLAAADEWMRAWMSAPKASHQPLVVGRFADRRYYLTQEIGWSPEPGQNGFPSVTVPKGFVTDFASIPRVFWSVLPPDGTYTYGAVIHDYLYWTQDISKAKADLILKFIMEEFKVDPLSTAAIFNGVDLGGGGAWTENSRLKNHGEKRVLRRFPIQATTTWAQWKSDPNNF